VSRLEKRARVYDLVRKKGLTIKQAATLLKKHPNSIRFMLERMRKDAQGGMPHFKPNVAKGLPTYPTPHLTQKTGQKEGSISYGKVRLHNVQLHITPSYIPERYHNRRVKGQTFRLENNTIRLDARTFEVYCLDDFFGVDGDDALRKAYQTIWGLVAHLERLLGVVIVKDTSAGVVIVRSHYAEVGNEFAQDANKRLEKVDFKGKDGKTWLRVDKSLGGDELECEHPTMSLNDINKVKPFFDDLRKQEHPLVLSEVLGLLDKQAKVNLETAQGLLAVVKILAPKTSESSELQVAQDKPAYIG
jgi:hypothetical protein